MRRSITVTAGVCVLVAVAFGVVWTVQQRGKAVAPTPEAANAATAAAAEAASAAVAASDAAAESARIRNALLQAAQNAERAHAARTPPDVLKAEKAAALQAFKAAEAEMLMQQTLARKAAEARAASAVKPPVSTTSK